jgi:hypothetical protein
MPHPAEEQRNNCFGHEGGERAAIGTSPDRHEIGYISLPVLQEAPGSMVCSVELDLHFFLFEVL